MKGSPHGLCGNSSVTVHAFADNELNASDRLAFKAHLSACPDCGASYRRIMALKALFKHSLLRHRAPHALRMRIASALEAGSRAAPAGLTARKSWAAALLTRPDLIRKERRRIKRFASALAASLAIATALILSLSGPALEDEIIGKYKRSLAVSIPADAPSAIFREGKMRAEGSPAFAPLIADLAEAGFTYKGARYERVAQRRTAVLIYAYESSVIDLFIWPSAAEPPGALSKQGYNIVHWTRAGLKFCAISTLTAGELSKFQEVFTSKLPA